MNHYVRWFECENVEVNLKVDKRSQSGQAYCHSHKGLKKHLFISPDDLAHPIRCEVHTKIAKNYCS